MYLFRLDKRLKIGLSGTAIMDIMASNVQQQRLLVDQLRREANMERIAVSEASNLIIRFIIENETDDCILNGFSNQKVNPFREKSSCEVL